MVLAAGSALSLHMLTCPPRYQFLLRVQYLCSNGGPVLGYEPRKSSQVLFPPTSGEPLGLKAASRSAFLRCCCGL